MKLLFIIAALLDAAAGLALLLIPGEAISRLLGAPLDAPTGFVSARIAGAGLLAFAISCWQARNGEPGEATTGLIEGMLFYDFGITAVLVYAGILLELGSPLLWPAIVMHFGIGIWCILNLRFIRRKSSKAVAHHIGSSGTEKPEQSSASSTN